VLDDAPRPNSGDRPAALAAVRASDREREDAVGALHAAGVAGRLTLEEIDQRVAAAYAARFRHELNILTTDLPARSAAHAPSGWVAVWNGVLRQSQATLLGTTPDFDAVPSRSQHVVGVLAVLAVLVWLALWVLIGFGVGVVG
jgi:hypothetical protein